ncbi:MAG: hypothetical protein ACI4Q8_01610, partial [Ruminococcus sp.]
MKKIYLILALVLVSMLFCGCYDNAKPVVIDSEYTEETSTESQTQSTTEGKLNAKVETVKVATDPTTPKKSKKKKKKKETDPTTPKKSKKKKKKKETEPVPTQGVVQPGRHIVVTTVCGSVNSNDMDFVYVTSIIKLNESMSSVFEKLGEDNISSELPKNKMEYDYSDFVITSYVDAKGVERLERIDILSEDVGTVKGAKIGSYGTELRRLYGEPNLYKGNTVTYTKG